MSNHKTYIVIDTDQKDNINWGAENIIEGKDTLRYSLDGTEFIIKWNDKFNTPPSVLIIPSEDKGNILTHQQAKDLMQTPEWNPEPPV